MREISKKRETKETSINVEINLDESNESSISCSNKFFSHMLEQLAKHSGFKIKLDANSLDGDEHHLIEDTAITLGEALCEALGDKRGIKRYASTILPMDDAMVLCALDISGRAYLNFDIDIVQEKTSDFETVLLYHFFESFAHAAKITLHIKKLAGYDPHHLIEAVFKAFARSLKEACSIDENKKNEIPSTKGVL